MCDTNLHRNTRVKCCTGIFQFIIFVITYSILKNEIASIKLSLIADISSVSALVVASASVTCVADALTSSLDVDNSSEMAPRSDVAFVTSFLIAFSDIQNTVEHLLDMLLISRKYFLPAHFS